MNIKIVVLERAVKWLIGGDLFAFVQDTVEAVNNSTISNDAKRAYVQKKTKEFFAEALSVFINLAIEVAVIIIKERIEDGN